MRMHTEAPSRVNCNVDPRGIASITLSRPEKHNAFDDAMIANLTAFFKELTTRSDVRVVLLKAEGRSFSAGADLAWMQRMAEYDYGHNLNDARALAIMLQSLKTLPQPTIVRVQGYAFGGAVGLISCCDIAIASKTAVFGLTETRIGLIPATIGPHVIEAIGPRWARRLFLTAERFDAALAEQIHLVHECCDEEALDARIDSLIATLLENGPEAMGAAKRLVHDVAGKPLDAQLIDDTSARIAHLRVSGEGQEGLKAFLEKRKPQWNAGSDS
jgi:methylglutaconyl-CoA hydratase